VYDLEYNKYKLHSSGLAQNNRVHESRKQIESKRGVEFVKCVEVLRAQQTSIIWVFLGEPKSNALAFLCDIVLRTMEYSKEILLLN
jgi:hypothetical protein